MEDMNMLYTRFLTVAVGALVAMSFAVSDAEAAKKKKAAKLTYEQAWAKCAPEVQSIPFWQESQRLQRGGACMRKLGHRI
jgi:hypothetical protein